MRIIKAIVFGLLVVFQGCNTSNAPDSTPEPITGTYALNPADQAQVERFMTSFNLSSARYNSANAYNNLGVKFDIEKDYITSLYFHRQALDMRLKAGQLEEAARSYNNLAVVYYMQGDYTQAEELYEKAIRLLSDSDLWKVTIENNYALVLHVISTTGARILSGPPGEDPPIRLIEADM